MIIPLPILWGQPPAIRQRDQIDQVVQNRNYRLIAGLSVDKHFEQVAGALVVSVGNGKFLRCRHVVEHVTPIPAALRKCCLEFFHGKRDEIGVFGSVIADLAAVQAAAVDRLKIEAGKYVDRILAVSVNDPGLWRTDFDGKIMYRAFCDSSKLSELCGISVIDHFAAADLAAGGNGRFLYALPFWLLAADRDARIARKEKIVLNLNNGLLLHLPISDGLDAEVPEIKLWRFEQTRFCPYPSETLGAAGKVASNLVPNQGCLREITDATDGSPIHLTSDPASLRALQAVLQPIIERSDDDQKIEVVCLGSDELFIGNYEAVRSISPKLQINNFSALGVSLAGLPAVLAAILGLMHVDQLPANLPLLTGSNSQRILGQLTLGRPSSWRHLIRVMADYQPAAMKLKDAV